MASSVINNHYIKRVFPIFSKMCNVDLAIGTKCTGNKSIYMVSFSNSSTPSIFPQEVGLGWSMVCKKDKGVEKGFGQGLWIGFGQGLWIGFGQGLWIVFG